MCMYDVFWQSSFGFCSVLDEVCAQELAGQFLSKIFKLHMYTLLERSNMVKHATGVPGVLSVHLDEKWDSDNKDSGGNSILNVK